MELTRAQLKENYASRGDQELVRLRATSELTDLARAVLDEELRERGINDSTIDSVRTETEAEAREREVFRSRFAPIPSRVAAYLIDAVGSLSLLMLVYFAVFVLTQKAGSEIAAWITLLGWWGYMLFKDGFNGQSLGKRILGIQVVAKKSGQPAAFSASFIRNLVLHLLGVIDWVFIFGEERQRLGDRGADTYVVRRAWAATPPP
jgi:uncharacterized RDD family membrane protein YckC